MEQFRELTGFWPHDETLFMFLASFLVMVVAKLVLEQLVLPLARLPASAYKQNAGDGSVLLLDPNLSFFTIHFLANAAVCWLALEDTLYYLSHPLTHRPSENVGHAIVMAVHVFHALLYKLSKADLIHHGVSVGLVGTIGWCVPWGCGLHAMDFFICGLPGGLDYGMLALVKAGMMDKMTNKRVNKWLNIAVRWPGILLVLNNMVVTKLQNGNEAPFGWVPVVLVLVLHGGNGLYFAARVVSNTAVAEYQLEQAQSKQE